MAANWHVKLHIDQVWVSSYPRDLYHARPRLAHWDMSFHSVHNGNRLILLLGQLELPQSLEISFVQSTNPFPQVMQKKIDVTGFSAT